MKLRHVLQIFTKFWINWRNAWHATVLEQILWDLIIRFLHDDLDFWPYRSVLTICSNFSGRYCFSTVVPPFSRAVMTDDWFAWSDAIIKSLKTDNKLKCQISIELCTKGNYTCNPWKLIERTWKTQILIIHRKSIPTLIRI